MIKNVNKFIALAIAVLMLLMVSTITVSAAEIDPTTGEEITETQNMVLRTYSAPVVAYDHKILWDATHGSLFSYTPSGDYSTLTTILNGMGYAVETTTLGVDNVNLAEYDILVVGLGSSWDTQYNTAEVDAIEDFVANGGGLLIMGDNVYCPNENIQPVAEAFGTQLGVSYPSDYFTNMASHPIFNDVSEFTFISSGGISGSSPSEEVAWNGQGFAGITVVNCPGKVVITGDINFCENDYISSADNEMLISNIFAWLGEPCENNNNNNIPEFPTIALPMIAIIGLALIMQRRE